MVAPKAPFAPGVEPLVVDSEEFTGRNLLRPPAQVQMPLMVPVGEGAGELGQLGPR